MAHIKPARSKKFYSSREKPTEKYVRTHLFRNNNELLNRMQRDMQQTQTVILKLCFAFGVGFMLTVSYFTYVSSVATPST